MWAAAAGGDDSRGPVINSMIQEARSDADHLRRVLGEQGGIVEMLRRRQAPEAEWPFEA